MLSPKRWLASKLKIDTYALVADEIICEKHPDRRVRLEDLRGWRQVFLCIGVWVIEIHTVDGKILEWSDSYGHLIKLLQTVAADKEEPFRAA